MRVPGPEAIDQLPFKIVPLNDRTIPGYYLPGAGCGWRKAESGYGAASPSH